MASTIYNTIKYHRCEPREMMDQHFSFGLTPNDFLAMTAGPTKHCNRSWRNTDQDAGSSIKEDKDDFLVNLDVQHFSSEEISVKTANGFLVVEAKHQEKKDEHGFISRSFTRRYILPEGLVADEVITWLSSDGVLSITAPLKKPQSGNEKIVPITKTGPEGTSSAQN